MAQTPAVQTSRPSGTPRYPPPPTRSAQPSSTSFSPSARTPFSAGQALETIRSPLATQQNVRTPSPNYFGLTIEKDYIGSSGTNVHTRGNWSPPTSNVRSTAAMSPRVVPLDQNPEFEAFRRQTQSFGFPSARLTSFHMSSTAMAAPNLNRAVSHNGITDSTTARSALTSMRPPTSPPQEGAHNHNRTQTATALATSPPSTHPFTPKQRSPKRVLPSPDLSTIDRPRRNSPAGFNERDFETAPLQLSPPSRDVRMSLPPAPQLSSPPRPPIARAQRSETIPLSLESSNPIPSAQDGPMLVSPQHLVNLLESGNEDILLLDLRVSTQYAKSRITGALNLCIPTTLLKRPAYNLTRLADTFDHDTAQKQKFEKWRNCQYIVVYDANSSKLSDATSSLNTLKKFVNEGWHGFQYVIRGGFVEFSKRFPRLVAHGTSQASGEDAPGTNVAPVIGGCPMPASTTKTAANPFFGNIRQNMDLIGGVGQIAVKQPDMMTQEQKDGIPHWLRDAADVKDNGKIVADHFLQIEKREQRRMQEALSGKVHYEDATKQDTRSKSVSLAGIEKGAKNRYNNIWPYEESRVKIGDVGGGCDYINANFLKAAWSNKRYIATQAPIPATFNDFWNVVWQQDARVIVMLTAEAEGGQVKAHNYWTERHYGPINVNFLSEHRASLELSRIRQHRNSRPTLQGRGSTNSSRKPSRQNAAPSQPANEVPANSDQPYVIVRRFTLSHANEPFAQMREVTQLQYTNWPDFGAPAHPAHLLGLVEQCDLVVRASYGEVSSPCMPEAHEDVRPVVVHCSAGCGRTGTFCTVDSVIDMLKRQRAEHGQWHTSPTKRRKPSPDVEDGSSSGDSESIMDVSPGTSIADSHNEREGHSGPGSFDWGTPQEIIKDEATDNVNGMALHHVDVALDKDEPPGLEMKHWTERDDIDMIEKTVEEFRHQRLSTVQSLRQFVLCYESVLEWLAEQH